MHNENQATSWGELLSGKNGIKSLTLVGGVALHAINVHITTTILPTVVNDIGGIDYYAWNTTIFVTTSILGSLLAPRLLGQAGPRASYAISALIFALGTMICSLAISMPVLLLGRGIQGLGGGFILALSYSMIRLVFSERLWPRAIALVSGMWGVATLIGPAVGGIYAELGLWRAAFWSLAPVIIMFGVLAIFILPAAIPKQDEKTRLPWIQLILLTSAVVIVSAASLSLNIMWNIAGLVFSAFLLFLIYRIELVSPARVLPIGAYKVGKLAYVYLTMSFLSMAVTSSEIFIPLFFQILHNQTPLVAGYLAAVMAAGWTLGSIVSSGYNATRANHLIQLAPVLILIGMVALAFLLPPVSGGNWYIISIVCVFMLLIGYSVGMTWPHLLTTVLTKTPSEELGLASASLTTIQLVTAALGAAIAGMVVNLAGLSHPGGQAGASNAAFWFFSSFALLPLIGIYTAYKVVQLRQKPSVQIMP